MTKEQVIKTLIRRTGLGLPGAIEVWRELSSNGFYEITRQELNQYIRENW